MEFILCNAIGIPRKRIHGWGVRMARSTSCSAEGKVGVAHAVTRIWAGARGKRVRRGTRSYVSAQYVLLIKLAGTLGCCTREGLCEGRNGVHWHA